MQKLCLWENLPETKKNNSHAKAPESYVISCCLQTKTTTKKLLFGQESPGPVVMGGNSCSKGCRLESQHYIGTGWTFSHLFVVKTVLFL